jgi:hypothetical protein
MSDQTTRREYDMRARLTKLFAGLTAVTALAFGGAALAGAASTPTPPAPPAAADTTQSGDQTAPDTGAPSSESSTEPVESASSSEAASPSDGPGGHADDPANATVDNQFEGVQ